MKKFYIWVLVAAHYTVGYGCLYISIKYAPWSWYTPLLAIGQMLISIPAIIGLKTFFDNIFK